MADVRMKICLRTVDGQIVDLTNEAFPSNMRIGQVLNEVQRLHNVSPGDVQLNWIQSNVERFKPKLMVVAASHEEERINVAENKKTFSVTTGYAKESSDTKGGNSTSEHSVSLSVGYSGFYVAASATGSVSMTTDSNWTQSRSQTTNTSETTMLEYSFPNGVFTQFCKWYVNVPKKDNKKEFNKFFLPGPIIQFTNGKDHNGTTMEDVQARQPYVCRAVSATGEPVDGGETADPTQVPKENTWFRIVNKNGHCLTFPGDTGSSSHVQLEVRPKKSGDYYNQQWSWAGANLDKLECRHNVSKIAGSGKDKLFVAVWHANSSNGSKVGMYKEVGKAGGPTWQSQKWTRDGESIVNGCGLLLSKESHGYKVHLWEDTGAQGQDWKLDYIGVGN